MPRLRPLHMHPLLCFLVIAIAIAASLLLLSAVAQQTSTLVNLTLLPPSALQRGAVCLDGSLPAYHLERGHGSGRNSWIVHLQGGGWCWSVQDCMIRSKTALGSSSFMTPQSFEGLLSNSPHGNPGFFNWNRVFVRYCDGASFSGNSNKTTLVTLAPNQKSQLYFRGQRVWEAIIEDLISNKDMGVANEAILSGESAGGLAAFHHCNNFKSKFSSNVIVKCLSDGGFFLDVPSITGVNFIKTLYQDVASLHNVTILPQSCTKDKSVGECFFPQYSLDSINVPMFFLQSSYDSWQVRNVIAPPQADPSHEWSSCTMSLANCTLSQLKIFQGFRETLVQNLMPLKGNKNWGIHTVSCLHHTQARQSYLWNGFLKVNNMTAAEAFSSWYFKNILVQNEDCEYPCNLTCH